MPQSLSKMYIHIIFSTKNRVPFLQDESLRKDLYGFMVGISKKLDSQIVVIGGFSDHIHLICCLSRNYAISEIVRELKRVSTKWIRGRSFQLKSFHWQNGYGAFSISPSHLDAVREYITNQSEHHKKVSFQDEYRKFLKKYGVEYDDSYVWD